jgi:hypothetical protein
MPGPIPDREANLARPRARKGAEQSGLPLTKGVAFPTEVPEPDENWHKIARLIWDGAVSSGQSLYYQNSDWAMLYSICDDITYVKNQGNKRSAQMLATVYAAMTTLLITEGDRRRLRVELEAPEAPVTTEGEQAVEEYKNLLQFPQRAEA